jgi:hypothetical protein
VRPLRCSACEADLILTSVVPDETVRMRGFEHHTYVCSACHMTERRVIYTKHGREDESVPLPRAAGPVVRRLSAPQEHAAAQGLLGRVVARLRGH